MLASRTIRRVDAAEDLSHQLWTLRELLEQLVFKLEVQTLLLGAGRARWIPFASAEIEAIIEAIAEVEIARETATRRLTAQRGLPPTAALSDLAAHIGPPWSTVLTQHRLHLLSLQAEVEELSRSNHELARMGMARTREVIAALGDQEIDVYDPHGVPSPLNVNALRLDRTV